jgi:hypothetical protein
MSQWCEHCRGSYGSDHYDPDDGDHRAGREYGRYGELLEAEQDATRLRELLGRLEWAGTHCERDREMAACPVCDVLADSEVVGQQPHAPGCWLAEELRR